MKVIAGLVTVLCVLSGAQAKGGVFGNYYRYSEVRTAGVSLQSQYPGILKFDSLPVRSIENRALYVIKVSNSPGANSDKPEALISGAMHAYEPIGVSVCMSDIMYLCSHYGSDPEIKWLIDNRQIYFIPVMNPDGYVYNETYPGMMWRKNRRPNAGGSYGVDLNRNYPYKWGYDNVGSSPNPSAWNYRGTAPASEPETQAMIGFVSGHRVRTWHNYHAPNDVLLIPFGYVNSYPWPDTLEYNTMCREESLLYGYSDWGNSYQAYGYVVNGGMEDWAWCDSVTYRIFGLVPEIGLDYWDGLNDSSIISATCQRVLPADIYLAQVAGFFPLAQNIVVRDSFPGGNNDGVLNPGETASLTIAVKNKAVVDTAFDLCGHLSTAFPALNISDSTGYYGNVIRLAGAVNAGDPYVVTVSPSASPGAWVLFNLRMTWDPGAYERPLACSLQIGPVTGVREAALSPGAVPVVRIKQNPARSVLNFTVCNIAAFSVITLIDVSGRVVASIAPVEERKQYDIALPEGIYFLHLESGDEVYTQKTIIVR